MPRSAQRPRHARRCRAEIVVPNAGGAGKFFGDAARAKRPRFARLADGRRTRRRGHKLKRACRTGVFRQTRACVDRARNCPRRAGCARAVGEGRSRGADERAWLTRGPAGAGGGVLGDAKCAACTLHTYAIGKRCSVKKNLLTRDAICVCNARSRRIVIVVPHAGRTRDFDRGSSCAKGARVARRADGGRRLAGRDELLVTGRAGAFGQARRLI